MEVIFAQPKGLTKLAVDYPGSQYPVFTVKDQSI